MTTLFKTPTRLLAVLFTVVSVASCSDDDSDNVSAGTGTSYANINRNTVTTYGK